MSFKKIFVLSLLIVILISLSAVSAEDTSFQDNAILSENSINEDIQESVVNQADNQLDDSVLEDDHSINENALDNSQLDFEDGQLADSNGNKNVLADGDLDTESQIAENINVSFDGKIFKNDTGYIDVELPEEASGYLRVTIDDTEIYNETITDKSVKIPIVFPPKLSPYIYLKNIINNDFTLYNISVYYNEIELDTSHTLMRMDYDHDHDYMFSLPKEILKDDNGTYQSAVLIFPYSVNSTVDIYLDDEFFDTFNASNFVFLNISRLNSLDLGNHRIRVEYAGDDYYLPSNKTYEFEVLDMIIEIPSKIVLEHDDCIYAKLVKYTDGKISVSIDGERVIYSSLDKTHEFLESLFNYITCGEHLVEIKYESKNFNRTKVVNVNVSYVVDILSYGYTYGDDNEFTIIVPTDFNKELINITIDGIRYTNFKIDNSGWIDLNISKFEGGNHTVIFDFIGDSKYYPITLSSNFTVDYSIKIPDYVDFGDGSAITLALPKNASGNLKVYVDDVLFKNVKLVNGKASIKVDNLSAGEHNITAIYTGNDYDINNLSLILDVYPNLKVPYPVKCGENKSIVLEFSKDSKGTVIFKIGKKQYKVPVKNGKASFSLKNLTLGEYDIDIEYKGENGFTHTLYASVEILPVKEKITGAKNLNISYTSNTYYKVKIYNNQSKLAKGVTVSFKVGKTTYKVKTDKNGVAKLKLSKLAPKKYTITVSYKGVKVSKKITVRHILKLNKVNVKKHAKKLVLKASLAKVNGKYIKGKVIKFQFKGKTYKAKTNSKGVAKVTIKKNVLKKLKVGKKITYKAIYLKDSAKRTVKIKK